VESRISLTFTKYDYILSCGRKQTGKAPTRWVGDGHRQRQALVGSKPTDHTICKINYMNCYKLNLDTNPIKPSFKLEHNKGDFWHVYPNVTDVLNEVIIKKFNDLTVVPNYVVIFSSPESSREEGFLHKDLVWKDNSWQTVPCAINWELRPVITKIKWYDTSKCTEYWPDKNFDDTEYPLNFLNGISYTSKICHESLPLTGIPDEAILLQESIIDDMQPVLFRTDIAHLITYKSKIKDRFMCSVRFNNIESWEQAVEKFGNIK